MPARLIGNRFEIKDMSLSLLGHGGMGDVYRATDLHTGLPAAVKVLRPDVVAAHPEVVDRFVREGEALRQLDHPNIVKVLAAVEEEGRHYLAVEYIGGGSLHDLLARDGPLPVERAVELAIDVADALTRAHRLGIIHRDLKPGNVLLDEAGIPHLADFGLARIASPRGPARPPAGASPLTDPGLVVGTLDYLSPEACRGQPLDARTDIWSFGAMLYEMLAGAPPFAADTALGLLSAILTQPVPDLAARRPDVPDALADLVYRMLEKDREQRIPSVRLVGAELEAIAGGWVGPGPGPRRFTTAGSPRPPTPGAAYSPLRAGRSGLPAQAIPFVGREQELADLDRLLAASRLVTVTGAGGMGKTRLALEAATAAAGRSPDGVYFVPLASLDSPDLLVPAIAGALGLIFYDQGDPKRRLLDYLHGRTLLLLLDNFEHLLPGAGLVADLLAAAPGVTVLVTSRARLNLQGEQVFYLAGMTAAGGARLFEQGARRARPGLELAPADQEPVARIVRLVEGMPLGILLAAAWVELLSPAEIAAEIERSFDFLEAEGMADLPERQRSLRAVFDYTWRLLAPREREVFERLSVFRGGLTRDAAQQVTGASLRELMALANKSLLYRSPSGRYEIHELLRQYVAARLAAAPPAEAGVRAHHAAYYLSALAAWGRDLQGSRQQQALAAIDQEDENIVAAWLWAAGHGPAALLSAAIDPLGYFYDWRGRYQEGASAFSAAASSPTPEDRRPGEEPGQADPSRGVVSEGEWQGAASLLPRLLAWQSHFARTLGHPETAQALLDRARALLDDAPPDPGLEPARAFVRLQLGHALNQAGDYHQARRHYGQSLALYRALDDRWGIANALSALGDIASSLSAFDEARRLLDESLALYRALGNRRGIAAALRTLGHLAQAQGLTAEAVAFLKESTAIQEELGDPTSLALGLSDWATMLSYSGEFDRSYELFEKALAYYRDLGNRPRIALTHADLANAESHRGRYDHALQYGEQALALAREVGERGVVMRTLFVQGGVLLAAGRPAAARPLLWESSELYRASGHQNALAVSLGALGGAALTLGDLAAARQYLTEALRIAVALRTFVPRAVTLALTARLLAEQGQVEQAVELYALLERYPFVARSHFFADAAGAPVAAAAAALPADVRAGARALGQVRDLDSTAAEILADLETWKPFLSPFRGLTGARARRGPV